MKAELCGYTFSCNIVAKNKSDRQYLITDLDFCGLVSKLQISFEQVVED